MNIIQWWWDSQRNSDIEWRSVHAIDEDYRQDVRDRFRWEAVLTKAGITFKTKPSGKIIILCLYHGEKTPSLHFWPNGSFFCFGCHVGWDIATFVFRHLQGTSDRPVSKSEINAFLESCVPEPDSQLKLPIT